MTGSEVIVNIQKVTILRRKGEAALVAWFEGEKPFRRIVQAADVIPGPDEQTGIITVDALHQGIDYGFPWSEGLTPFTVTPETIELALHQNGIWTAEDAARDPAGVLGAITTTYRPVFEMIAHAIKQHKQGVSK